VPRLAKRQEIPVAWSGVVMSGVFMMALAREMTEPDPLYARVWRLLRIRRKLTTAEAVALLCDGDDSAQTLRHARHVVQRYLRHLHLAGYLTQTQPGARSGKRYVLVRDSGPGTPLYQRPNMVYDPNDRIRHVFLA